MSDEYGNDITGETGPYYGDSSNYSESESYYEVDDFGDAGDAADDWLKAHEESTAVGGQVVIHPQDALSLKFGYVDVSADNGKNRDDFSEFNFDGKYVLTDQSKIRVRYSIKDQTDTSSREDRDDFRIIYYMNF